MLVYLFMFYSKPQSFLFTISPLQFSDTKKKALPFPPLKHIFVTPAFLALTLVHFGQSWGYITLMTEIPSYLNNVHHYSVSSVGRSQIKKIMNGNYRI